MCIYYIEKNVARCGQCGTEIKPGDDYCIRNKRVMCGVCGAGAPMQKAEAKPVTQAQAHAEVPPGDPGAGSMNM
jgi:hypothetical protein